VVQVLFFPPHRKLKFFILYLSSATMSLCNSASYLCAYPRSFTSPAGLLRSTVSLPRALDGSAMSSRDNERFCGISAFASSKKAYQFASLSRVHAGRHACRRPQDLSKWAHISRMISSIDAPMHPHIHEFLIPPDTCLCSPFIVDKDLILRGPGTSLRATQFRSRIFMV